MTLRAANWAGRRDSRHTRGVVGQRAGERPAVAGSSAGSDAASRRVGLVVAASCWLVVVVLAFGTYALRRAAVRLAVDLTGGAGASAFLPRAFLVLPLATTGLVLVWRSKARGVGWVGLLGALGLAVGLFGSVAVSYATPPPLSLRGAHVPALGAIATIGSVSFALAVPLLAVGVLLVFGNGRLGRREMAVARVGAVGAVLVALGFALRPDRLVVLYVGGEPVSPLGIPRFDTGAATLRFGGVLVVGVAVVLAVALFVRRWLDVPAALRLHYVRVGGAAGCSAALAGVGTVSSVANGVALLAAALVLPVVIARGAHALASAPRPDPREPGFVALSGRSVVGVGSFDRAVSLGLVAARLGAAVWAVTLYVGFDGEFSGGAPRLLVAGVVLSAVVVAVLVLGEVRRPDVRLVVGVEVLLAALIAMVDGVSSRVGHLFSGAASLGGPWPQVVVVAAGVVGGPWFGAAAGAVVGFGRIVGVLASGTPVFASQAQGLLASFVGVVVLGAGAGAASRLLRDAEATIASARARDAVARRLHDGVLQALAVIRRRSTDPELVELAADADVDLRSFLDAGELDAGGDLGQVLRSVADDAARRLALQVDLAIDELPRRVTPGVLTAVAGAVSEALVNVAKHAKVSRATVYAGRGEDRRFFVSVIDTGVGFDPGQMTEGRGIRGSINERMAEVGGDATMRALAGGGTEVLVWLP